MHTQSYTDMNVQCVGQVCVCPVFHGSWDSWVRISERSDLARIINKAKVKQLLTKAGTVCGVTYEKKGKDFTEEGPVILATGGFGADFTDDSWALLRFGPAIPLCFPCWRFLGGVVLPLFIFAGFSESIRCGDGKIIKNIYFLTRPTEYEPKIMANKQHLWELMCGLFLQCHPDLWYWNLKTETTVAFVWQIITRVPKHSLPQFKYIYIYTFTYIHTYIYIYIYYAKHP